VEGRCARYEAIRESGGAVQVHEFLTSAVDGGGLLVLQSPGRCTLGGVWVGPRDGVKFVEEGEKVFAAVLNRTNIRGCA
jgi:hypothetical protein